MGSRSSLSLGFDDKFQGLTVSRLLWLSLQQLHEKFKHGIILMGSKSNLSLGFVDLFLED